MMDEPKGLFRHKILVVDDQVGIVSFLYEFFAIKGYEVLQAIDGKQALEIVKKESPPVVLLDIRMGWGMDGIEVLKEIKRISPKTGVIMMTSVCEQEVIQEAFDNGAADYLVKPFSLEYLEQIVVSKILNLEIRQIGEA